MKKEKNIIIYLSYIQLVLYLFGFINHAMEVTGYEPMVSLNTFWQNPFGLIFWSVLSMISVCGTIVCIHILTVVKPTKERFFGTCLTIAGFCLPLVFFSFLIIPTGILLLASYYLSIKEEK